MMDDIKENICRLCLKFGDDTFSDYSDLSSKEKLRAVVPNLNVDNPTDFVVCSKCRISLEESYQFIKTYTETDKFIQKEKNYLKIGDKVDLTHIVHNTKESGNTGENICRICLKSRSGKYTDLSKGRSISLSNVLYSCLAKLDLQLTIKPEICQFCLKTLYDTYNFQTKCTSVEQKVLDYCKSTSKNEVDLNEVLDFLNGVTRKNVSNESKAKRDNKDLEPKKVSNQTNLQNTDTNKKRTLPEESHDSVPQKKQKSDAESKEECGKVQQVTPKSKDPKGNEVYLPPFSFSYNLLVDPREIGELEEWLSTVDRLKHNNNWTDLVTIAKVLEKLEAISEIYHWFSNISKIMTWEEWKKKLLQVFPDQNDYYNSMKKIINRKKRQTETFVEYYEAKMEILSSMNITGANAVCCLIGGVTDVVVGCVARAGNYKSPEELLLYFKTCDSKNPVVAKPPETNGTKVEKSTVPDHIAQKRKNIKCHSCKRFGHIARECDNSQKMKEIQSQNSRTEKIKGNTSSTVQDQGERNRTTQKQTSSVVSTKQTEKTNINRDNVTPLEHNKGSNLNTDKSGLKPQERSEDTTKKDISDDARSQVQNKTSSLNNTTSGATHQKQVSSINKVTSTAVPQSHSEGKGTSSTKPQAKSEVSNQDKTATTPHEQNKRNNVSTVKSGATPKEQSENTNNRGTHSATSQTRSDVKGTPSAAGQEQKKGSDFTSFVKPLPPSATRNLKRGLSSTGSQKEVSNRGTQQEQRQGGNTSRGTSGGRPHHEVDNRTDSSSTPQDRKGGHFNRAASDSKVQERKVGDNIHREPSTPQDRKGGGHFNRGASDSKVQERKDGGNIHREPTTPQDRKGGGHFNRGASDSKVQERKDGGNIHREPSGVRPQSQREVNRGTPAVTPQVHRASYPNRGTYDSKFPEREDRSNVNRGTPTATPQQHREGSYPYRGISDSIWQERSNINSGTWGGRSQEQWDSDYIDRGTFSARSEERRDESYINKGTSGIRPQEQREGSYFNRGMPGIRSQFQSEEINIDNGISSARPQEQREGSNFNRSLLSNMLQEQIKGSITDRDLSSDRLHEERRGSYMSGVDSAERNDRSGEGTSNVRDLLSTKLQEQMERSIVSRETSSTRPDVSREDSRFGRGTRSPEEREAAYADRGISNVRQQEDEERMGRYLNRAILSTISSEQTEVGSADRDTPSVRPEEVWQSGYLDESVSAVRPRDDRDVTAKAASSVRQPDEEMEGRYSNRGISGPRPGEETDRYFNRDTPSSAPQDLMDRSYFNSLSGLPQERGDVSYPKELSSTAIPREPTEATIGARPPVKPLGSYYNRSISSTRLLGSSLSSLFSLSLASARPVGLGYGRYSSSRLTTDVRPLRASDDSYFNRGLSRSGSSPNFPDGNRGMSKLHDVNEGMFSRRSTSDARMTEPRMDSYYNRGISGMEHEEQSHRELCLKCYTIGHNLRDCPKSTFRT